MLLFFTFSSGFFVTRRSRRWVEEVRHIPASFSFWFFCYFSLICFADPFLSPYIPFLGFDSASLFEFASTRKSTRFGSWKYWASILAANMSDFKYYPAAVVHSH
jgi:hypothetical protein